MTATIDRNEASGVLIGPGGEQRRWRIGASFGQVFSDDEDFDGVTLQIEVKDRIEGEGIALIVDGFFRARNALGRTEGEIAGFIGRAPEEPDDIPKTPPSGFFHILPGTWSGTDEVYGLSEVRVMFEGETLDFEMTLEDAVRLQALLEWSIRTMMQGIGQFAAAYADADEVHTGPFQ